MKALAKIMASIAVMLTLCVTLTISAQADMVIDFDVLGPAGSISYAGGTAPLIGTSIPIDYVAGLNTPSHSSPPSFPITDGVLNFQTGNFDFYYSLGQTWFFNGGGEITIRGTVKNGSNTVASGDLLYNGVFDSAQVVRSGSTYIVAMAFFSDYKNADLLRFFGVPWAIGQPLDGGLNIQFQGTVEGDHFSSTLITSGDVANTVPIPVPPTALLLGSGLLGLAGLRWRCRKQS